MSSQSTLEALEQVFLQKIEYFALVTHNTTQYYICVGTTAFFFIDTNFDQIQGEVEYKYLQRVLLDLQNKMLIQIHIQEGRQKHVPAKMNLFTEDRKQLVKFLQFCWKTNHITNSLLVHDLPVYKSQIEIRDESHIVKPKLEMPKEFLDENEMKMRLESQQEYSFFINYVYQKKKEIGVFYKSDDSKITVQITQPLPLELLNQIGSRCSLQFCAHNYTYQLFGKQTNYHIIQSNPYFKRHQLSIDNAQWQGWEIICIQKEPYRQFVILYLRRKYLPPLMENYVDFCIVLHGDKLSKNNKKKKIVPSPEQEIWITRYIADSLFSTSPIKTIYEIMLVNKLNALLFDEDDYDFFQKNGNYYPKYVHLAHQFLIYILKRITNTMIPAVNELRTDIDKRIKKLILPNDDMNLTEKLPDEVPKYFIPKYFVEKTFTNDSNDFEAQKLWKFKLSKYIAFCIDGGFLGKQSFNISMIIESLKDNRAILMEVLDYLLYLSQERSDFDFMELPKKLQKMIQNPTSYIFNQRIMAALVENHYFTEVFLIQEEQENVYIDFMVYFLLDYNSIVIKQAVCNHIIGFIQKQVNEGVAVIDKIASCLSELIPALILTYKSNDVSLHTIACVALINLQSYSKDARYKLMKDGNPEIIMQQLLNKDQTLVRYTLQLIYNLSNILQHLEIFYQLGILQNCFSLLSGTGISNAYYSYPILQEICKLLRLLLQNNLGVDEICNEIKLYCDLINPEDEYFDEIQLKIELLNLVNKILSVDEKQKENCSQYLSMYLVELIKQGITGQLFQRSVSILKELISIQTLQDELKFDTELQIMFKALLEQSSIDIPIRIMIKQILKEITKEDKKGTVDNKKSAKK